MDDQSYTIGVTGHIAIEASKENGYYELLLSVFRGAQLALTPRAIRVLSPLAAGADTLSARAALQSGCALWAPLPMRFECYREDFDAANAGQLDALLGQAERVIVADERDPAQTDLPRGYFYRQAGLYVARHSHLLIALWDGKETLFPQGGGTYETVDFVRNQRLGEHNPRGKVLQIVTPRAEGSLYPPLTMLLHADGIARKCESREQLSDFFGV